MKIVLELTPNMGLQIQREGEIPIVAALGMLEYASICVREDLLAQMKPMRAEKPKRRGKKAAKP